MLQALVLPVSTVLSQYTWYLSDIPILVMSYIDIGLGTYSSHSDDIQRGTPHHSQAVGVLHRVDVVRGSHFSSGMPPGARQGHAGPGSRPCRAPSEFDCASSRRFADQRAAPRAARRNKACSGANRAHRRGTRETHLQRHTARSLAGAYWALASPMPRAFRARLRR